MADSALKQRLTEDMKNAMRAKAKERLGVIRLIIADIKRKEIDERIELDDAAVLIILDKMVKQRRDSIQQFEAAGRDELAAQEKFEIGIIQEYLPAQLSEAEITDLVTAAVKETGAQTMKDMGKLMVILKPQLQGRADMGVVSKQIKALLG
jgi:uncharacterized protein YqeY